MGVRIGIRELRQHASQYLRRVRAGETITVTDRGEPIAELRPVSRGSGILERMIAEGRATPAKEDLTEFLKEHPPLPMEPGEEPLSATVIQARAEERY